MSTPGQGVIHDKLIPGEIEKEAEKMNSINGIKVLPGIQDELKEIAGKLGMDFELRK